VNDRPLGRVLVTGGAGFIGSALVWELNRRGTEDVVVCDVLDLTPEAIGGPVDVVFLGALLIHLRDPVRALERIFSTLAPGGALYQLEAISLPLTLRHPRSPVACLQTLGTGFNWWYPNWATLRTWLATAGFTDIRPRGMWRPPQRRPMNDRLCGIHSRRPAA